MMILECLAKESQWLEKDQTLETQFINLKNLLLDLQIY